MKKTRLLVLVVVLMALLVPAVATAAPEEKVTVCHISPNGRHEIVIDASALPSHLEHGDYQGSCFPTD